MRVMRLTDSVLARDLMSTQVYSLEDCTFLAARPMMRYMRVAGFPRNLGDDGRRSGGFSKLRCPVLRGECYHNEDPAMLM